MHDRRWVPARQPETSVRPATTADASAIGRIGRAAFPQTHAGILDDDAISEVVEQSYAVPALRQCIDACAEDPDAHFLVAERRREVVGYLHFDTLGEEPELHRIYVDPPLTRRGIGTALIGDLHRRLAPGSWYILMVAAANDGALRFYARHGFVEAARVDGREFYRQHTGVEFSQAGPAVPALVLRRTLGGEPARGEPPR